MPKPSMVQEVGTADKGGLPCTLRAKGVMFQLSDFYCGSVNLHTSLNPTVEAHKMETQ